MKTILLLILFFPAAALPQQLLTPEEAVKTALEKNYSIMIAANNFRIAGNNVSTGNAGFLPELSADGSYTRSTTSTRQEFFDGRIIDRDNAVSENLNTSLSLNWIIFDGMKMFASLSRLKELRISGELNLRNEVEINISELYNAYYNIVREQKLLRLIQSNIGLSEERLRIEKDKKELGSSSGFDLRKAQVDLNEDKASYLREELRLVQYKLRLKELMGIQDDAEFSVIDSIPLRKEFEYEELAALLDKNNSTLLLASADRNIAELESDIAWSDIFPRISLTAGYSFVKSEAQAGLIQSNQNRGYNYGIRASWNIFNGLNTRREIQNADILIENARLGFEEIRQLVISDLRDAHKRFTNSISQIDLEMSNMRSAEENVDIALERLKLGNISPLEFREAQTDLLDAQNRLVSAQVEAKLAETDLLRLSGLLVKQAAEK